MANTTDQLTPGSWEEYSDLVRGNDQWWDQDSYISAQTDMYDGEDEEESVSTPETPEAKCQRLNECTPMELALSMARSAVSTMRDDCGGDGTYSGPEECLDNLLGNILDTLDELGLDACGCPEANAASALMDELTDSDENLRGLDHWGPDSRGAKDRAARA